MVTEILYGMVEQEQGDGWHCLRVYGQVHERRSERVQTPTCVGVWRLNLRGTLRLRGNSLIHWRRRIKAAHASWIRTWEFNSSVEQSESWWALAGRRQVTGSNHERIRTNIHGCRRYSLRWVYIVCTYIYAYKLRSLTRYRYNCFNLVRRIYYHYWDDGCYTNIRSLLECIKCVSHKYRYMYFIELPVYIYIY